jgi:hypothetical protein
LVLEPAQWYVIGEELAVKEIGEVLHRPAEGLMLSPLICPRTYC